MLAVLMVIGEVSCQPKARHDPGGSFLGAIDSSKKNGLSTLSNARDRDRAQALAPISLMNRRKRMKTEGNENCRRVH